MTILKPRSRLTQKRQLLGRGRAAEDGVAVRVTPKAPGDGLVALFEAQGVFHARLRKQAGGLGVHQDLGQTPLGRGAPSKQLTTRRSLEGGPEAGADGFVQGRVFGEVVLGGEFVEPEVEDGVGLHDSIHADLPIRWAAMQVGNGHDQNALRILAVNHAVGESAQTAAAGVL